ncbi:MAG: lysostaphin resistance A-like protein [Caldilineaceae bacterium]
MKSVETSVAIRQLILFTLLVNGLAWLGPLLGGDPTAPGLGVLVWGTAPFVATLVMKFVVRDKTALGLNLALRGNGRWYALSALIYPLAIALVLGVGLLIGATTIHNVTIPTLLTAMMPLAVTYFIFAFFEEVGWRGYLTPKVAGINNGRFGYVVIGVIWASWHFPYLRELWAHTSEVGHIAAPFHSGNDCLCHCLWGNQKAQWRCLARRPDALAGQYHCEHIAHWRRVWICAERWFCGICTGASVARILRCGRVLMMVIFALIWRCALSHKAGLFGGIAKLIARTLPTRWQSVGLGRTPW